MRIRIKWAPALIGLVALTLLLGLIVPADASDSTWTFGGGRLDFKPTGQLKLNTGTAIPLGKHLWWLPSTDLGPTDTIGSRSSTANLDFSWNFYNSSLVSAHVLLGGNLDWTTQPEGAALLYLNAATGGMVLVHLNGIFKTSSGLVGWAVQTFSIYGAYEYKTDFKGSTSRFPAGNRFALGIAWRGKLRLP